MNKPALLFSHTKHGNFMVEKMDRLDYSVLLSSFVFPVHLKVSGL